MHNLPELPEAFLLRMQSLLLEEYPLFLECFKAEATRTLRVQTSQMSAEVFAETFPELCHARLAGHPNAYTTKAEKPGNHYAHQAGLFYMQDPSAMGSITALAVKKGWKVLDLCAAPGGKSTQLSECIGETGVLLSNEIHPTRVKILQSNLERTGCGNVYLTNTDAKTLAENYPSSFDLVVVDAPCSGEGMFRKYAWAVEEWSEENVKLCAMRQRDILKEAQKTVKDGGYLLYSTCTFSLEENEENMAWFLENYQDFSMMPVSERLMAISTKGVALTSCPETEHARRFYPHKTQGEGQFVALLQKNTQVKKENKADENKPDDRKPSKPKKTKRTEANPNAKEREDTASVTTFLAETLRLGDQGTRTLADNLINYQGAFYLLPQTPFPLKEKGLYLPGVPVGKLERGRVLPHHWFFKAYGNLFRLKLALSKEDDRVAKFLHGEEIDVKDTDSLFEDKETNENKPSGNKPNENKPSAHKANATTQGKGFCVVLYEGVPIGGGKLVGNRIKNYYPKGLRM